MQVDAVLHCMRLHAVMPSRGRDASVYSALRCPAHAGFACVRRDETICSTPHAFCTIRFPSLLHTYSPKQPRSQVALLRLAPNGDARATQHRGCRTAPPRCTPGTPCPPCKAGRALIPTEGVRPATDRTWPCIRIQRLMHTSSAPHTFRSPRSCTRAVQTLHTPNNWSASRPCPTAPLIALTRCKQAVPGPFSSQEPGKPWNPGGLAVQAHRRQRAAAKRPPSALAPQALNPNNPCSCRARARHHRRIAGSAAAIAGVAA